MDRRALLGGSLFLASDLTRGGPARGGTTPTHPLALVVPFSAGSTNDILARFLAEGMAAPLGQPVVVDNRPGAGGTLGAAYVARQRSSDGSTLLLVSMSTIPINRALYSHLSYDPWQDLPLIGLAASTPNALIVAGNSPWRNVAELKAAALARAPQGLRYFSPGNGTSQHLSCVQVLRAANMPSEHIPYRGPPEGITALMAGEVDWGFSALPSITALVDQGQIRALGITGTSPAPVMPAVPTLASAGLAGFEETDVWYGLSVPRDTSGDVFTMLRSALRNTLDDPAMQAKLTAAGFYRAPVLDGPAQDAFLNRQVRFWAELVRISGARID